MMVLDAADEKAVSRSRVINSKEVSKPSLSSLRGTATWQLLKMVPPISSVESDRCRAVWAETTITIISGEVFT